MAVEREIFCSSGAFKTNDNLWEGENQVILIQKSISGGGMGGSMPVRAVTSPG
jgi:hypothetical protein